MNSISAESPIQLPPPFPIDAPPPAFHNRLGMTGGRIRNGGLMTDGNMTRKATIIIWALIALPSIAHANPNPSGMYAPVGLFAEALIIAVILGFNGFDPVRLFYSWGVVTIVTFEMLARGIVLCRHFVSSGNMQFHWFGFWLFVLAELAIVLVEALALLGMTRVKFFQRKEVKPLRFWQAFLFSVLVNGVSLLFGQ